MSEYEYYDGYGDRPEEEEKQLRSAQEILQERMQAVRLL
jgi:hypothetical protein